ncbi:MAG: formylmethanofuran dehydrogenase [Gammaproteobacteria bacterium]
MTVPQPTASEARTAVCPFCALLCDDVGLRPRQDGTLSVARNGCKRAAAGFARRATRATPLLAGAECSLEEAVAAAAKLLRRARQPLLAGLASDIDGMRALVDLAERSRAITDHLSGEVLTAVARVLQTRGWYATTLSEVRNRADFVLVVDVDFAERYEEFPRRCLTPKARLAPGAGPRRVAFLGRTPTGLADADLTVSTSAKGVHDALLAVLARLRAPQLPAVRAGGARAADIDALAAALEAATNTAIVFSPAMLGDAVEPIMSVICDIVDRLNETARAAILSLSGDNGAQSAVAVSAWLTGYPLRTSFGATTDYAPEVNATRALLERGDVDALMWVDAYGEHAEPPARGAARAIVLGAVPPADPGACDVFIPVGTPGVDHAARLARTDSSVTLALEAQRDAGLPAVADVARRILAAW